MTQDHLISVQPAAGGWTVSLDDLPALMFLSGLVIMVGLTGVDRRYRAEDRAAAAAASAEATASERNDSAEAPALAEMAH